VNKKCKYSGCEYDTLNGQEFCYFHAPADKKMRTLDRFNESVFSRLKTGKYNLDGYVFPGPINFENTTFEDQPTFKDAIFSKGVIFRNTKFKKGADFSQCEFRGEVNYARAFFGEVVNFHAAKFIGANVIFDSAVFEGQVAGFATSSFHMGAVRFLNVKFACKWVDFSLITFTDTQLNFARCDFASDNTAFANIEFNNTIANWNSAKFRGTKLDFSFCEFSNCPVDFTGAEFGSQMTAFDNTVFTEKKVSFKAAKFTGGEVTFLNTQFKGTLVDFSSTQFYGDLRFRSTLISNELKFIDTRFKDGAALYLSDPVFKPSTNFGPRVLFQRVRFNPFLSFFEGIRAGSDFVNLRPTQLPIILFRYSQLKDVYFADNDMSLFSFCNSAFFEDAHFIQGRWIQRKERILSFIPIKFTRRNQIVEEQLLEIAFNPPTADQDNKNLHEHFQTQLLKTHSNVADLYLRFKTAADRAKNYHLARWFYFNEFEMKRKGHLEQLKQCKNWIARLGILPRFSLYSSYRLLAGYGEMTWWSFIWFAIFTAIFAILHLFNGIRIPSGSSATRIINYDWQKALPNVWQFLGDFFNAVLFTLYRIIPVSYLPYQRLRFDLVDYGFWDLALTLANSVVLVLMIIFIGMGLKRHFRRF
jgi:hypothetical protein